MKYIVLKKSCQKIAIFILGVLVGLILAITQIGSNIDRLNQENNELKLKLENTLTELEQIKEKNKENKGYVVTNIETEISLVTGELTAQEQEKLKLTIAKEIAEHYKSIVGSKVSSLNPLLLPKLVDGRLFKIEDKYYKIFVKTVIVSETLLLSVEVIPQ